MGCASRAVPRGRQGNEWRTHLSKCGDERATQARRELVVPVVMAGAGWLLETVVMTAAVGMLLLLLL